MLVVDVTDKHIKKGIRNNPFFCPVAIALTETTKRTWAVHAASAHCEDHDYNLSDGLKTWIGRFDRGNSVFNEESYLYPIRIKIDEKHKRILRIPTTY